MVRLIGLEPTRLATPDPKSGASTNFATSAKCSAKVIFVERQTKCFERKNGKGVENDEKVCAWIGNNRYKVESKGDLK